MGVKGWCGPTGREKGVGVVYLVPRDPPIEVSFTPCWKAQG